MTTGPIGPGTVIAGRYRLDDLITESAGARFWRATDTVLARSVAIHAVPSSDPRAPGLLAAARVSAWLGHWDFLAATAEDGFRKRLLVRLAQDARGVVASLPAVPRPAALDGLLLAAVPGRGARAARSAAVHARAGPRVG